MQFASGESGTVYAATGRAPDDIKEAMEAIGIDASSMTLQAATGKTLPALGGANRYVLDNFSDLADAHGWDVAFKALQPLQTTVRKTGGLALVTVTEGLHTEAELTRLRMWADGAMEMGFDRQGFGLYPYLKITKMRGVPDSARFLLFKETPKGLFMESTRRVF